MLLLPDIAGARLECLNLALKISAEPQAYKVYIPVLFGSFGESCKARFIRSAFFGESDWNVYSPDKDSMAFEHLLTLCKFIRDTNNGQRVIVIGNCFT